MLICNIAQLFIAAIYIRNPNLYVLISYTQLQNRPQRKFAAVGRCFLLYSAIFVPSFIITVPMSGTFALPLTEVSVKSSSIWASLPRSSRAVTVDYLESVFPAVVKNAKRDVAVIKHVADF